MFINLKTLFHCCYYHYCWLVLIKRVSTSLYSFFSSTLFWYCMLFWAGNYFSSPHLFSWFFYLQIHLPNQHFMSFLQLEEAVTMILVVTVVITLITDLYLGPGCGGDRGDHCLFNSGQTNCSRYNKFFDCNHNNNIEETHNVGNLIIVESTVFFYRSRHRWGIYDTWSRSKQFPQTHCFRRGGGKIIINKIEFEKRERGEIRIRHQVRDGSREMKVIKDIEIKSSTIFVTWQLNFLFPSTVFRHPLM